MFKTINKTFKINKMSGYNHIVGGTVFTGIFLSMYDVNIFSQPIYLFFTAFFSVLPDVDHTKAPIGKMFYPFARYLDKKYGHRTITHSLLIYGILFFIVGIIESFVTQKTIIASIFLWSFASHLILDMITKQGVPLFYPFLKNACVIPANPSYRFKSSDFKTEAMVFIFFVFLAFSCKNLFANGFWNSYNRTFANIKHINNEARIYDGAININYEVKVNSQGKKGTGLLIETTQNELILFDKEFIKITDKDRIIKLIPIRTKKQIVRKDVQFNDITGDSLRSFIRNKMIIKLRGEGTIPIIYTKENVPTQSTTLTFDYVFNPAFRPVNIDTIDLQVERDMQILLQEIANNRITESNERAIRKENLRIKTNLEKVIAETEKEMQSEDLYKREKAQRAIQSLRNQYQQLQPTISNQLKNNSYLIRLNYLKSKLHTRKINKISGYLTYIELTN